MAISVGRTRIVAAAAALSCAAVALPVTALAATSTGSGRPATVSTCAAARTQPWIGVGNGVNFMGVSYYPLEFTNTGKTACSFDGYPAVAAVTAAGRPVGPAGTQTGSKQHVVLQPGQTGHVILGILVAQNFGDCKLVKEAYLKVAGPGQKTSQIIEEFPFAACSNHGVLGVDAMHPGAGIPGFSTS